MKKTCSHCRVEKFYSQFHRQRQKPDGLRSWCKDCRRILEGDTNRIRVRGNYWTYQKPRREQLKLIKQMRRQNVSSTQECGFL